MENQAQKKHTPKFLIVGFVLIILAFIAWSGIKDLSLLVPFFLPVPLLLGGTGVIFIVTDLLQLLFRSKNSNESQAALREVKPFNKKAFVSIIVFGVVVLAYLIYSLYPYIVKK